MKMKLAGYAALISAIMIVTACGSEEAASEKPKEETTASAEEKQTETKETNDSKSDELNPNIAEESQGDVEVIYTKKDLDYVHDIEGFIVSVDQYEIVSVKDIAEDHRIWFDDQTEGYIVTAHATVDNQTDKAMYYNANFRIQARDEYEYYQSSNRDFIREEDRLVSKTETETSKFAAGEKVSGLITFTLTNEEFEVLKTTQPKFMIEGGVADNDMFEGGILGNEVFEFAISDESAEKIANQESFYEDEILSKNIAQKKMIFEKENINDTQKIENVNVTVEGVQYTELTPTETHKETFKNFGDSGVAALTVKLKIDNQSDMDLDISSLGTILSVDDDRARYLAELSLEPRENTLIKQGGQGEKIHVFLFRKDEFELYKKFSLEFGPFRGDDGKDLFKGRNAVFTLPR